MSLVSEPGVVYEWINSFSKHLGSCEACKSYCLESRMTFEMGIPERKTHFMEWDKQVNCIRFLPASRVVQVRSIYPISFSSEAHSFIVYRL